MKQRHLQKWKIDGKERIETLAITCYVLVCVGLSDVPSILTYHYTKFDC